MSNMSYCRFQNTLMDLRDCQENMDDRGLSPEEKRARKALIDVCWRIAQDYGDESGDVEEDVSDDEEDEPRWCTVCRGYGYSDHRGSTACGHCFGVGTEPVSA